MPSAYCRLPVVKPVFLRSTACLYAESVTQESLLLLLCWLLSWLLFLFSRIFYRCWLLCMLRWTGLSLLLIFLNNKCNKHDILAESPWRTLDWFSETDKAYCHVQSMRKGNFCIPRTSAQIYTCSITCAIVLLTSSRARLRADSAE